MADGNGNGPDLVALERESVEMQQVLKPHVVITDQISYDEAVAARVKAKAVLDRINEIMDPVIAAAHQTHKTACTTKGNLIRPITKQMQAINQGLIKFDAEQARLQREEQARLQAEPKRKAEEDRLAEAQAMKDAGVDEESIDEHISAPVIVHTPVIAAPIYTRSSSVVMRDNWKAKVTDLWALVKAVAKDKSKINLLKANDVALNQQAKSLKDNLNLPGVQAYNDRGVASGRN